MKIRVLPNPIHVLDHLGRGMCAVATENAMTWIGARVDHESSLKEGCAVFVFDSEPVEVDLTPYYARKVLDGELLAADEATAAACGVKWQSKKSIRPAAIVA